MRRVDRRVGGPADRRTGGPEFVSRCEGTPAGRLLIDRSPFNGTFTG